MKYASQRIWRVVLGVMLVVALSQGLAQAQPGAALLGSNLIVNGDAEAGPGSTDTSTVPVPGWTTMMGEFTAVQYGAGSFPTTTDPGPPNRGLNLFAGGDGADQSQAVQTIDVSALAGEIDTGTLSYTLSGYFGGFEAQRDNAFVYVSFKDGSTSLDVSPQVGEVTPADRANATGLLPRSVVGTVPAGTRSIEVYLMMLRLDGSYNDGYADNLSLVLGPPMSNLYLPLVVR